MRLAHRCRKSGFLLGKCSAWHTTYLKDRTALRCKSYLKAEATKAKGDGQAACAAQPLRGRCCWLNALQTAGQGRTLRKKSLQKMMQGRLFQCLGKTACRTMGLFPT